MSSPFPIPGISSSPFPFPSLPQMTQPQTQAAQNGGNTSSPAPFASGLTPLNPGPIFAPSPLSQLISSTINPSANANSNVAGQSSNSISNFTSTGLTPGIFNQTTPNFFPTSTSNSNPPAANTNGITPNTSALLASVGVTLPGLHSNANANAHTNTNSTLNPVLAGLNGVNGVNGGNGGNKESLVLGLNELENTLSKLEELLGEMREIESRVFEGAKVGDEEKLIALHTEYNQSLQNIISLSQSTLVASLPLITSAPAPRPFTDNTLGVAGENPSPNPNPNPSSQPTLNDTPTNSSNLTIADLSKWSEERAALEFTRRENTKVAAKSVVDILKGNSNANVGGR
ncbi:uncharacterized protein I303_102421 [Kwoniella dejecticola CBS 10117]|uniref:Uncharacterized protein n=1 Tax=Kwoniella dejecticola CBS 10117 TaxID=1296121 RepID=A0A1A6A8P4_9TREE|nr:uncharacterized protein I303_02436 [Kwoniella dejecticola CBS 10117]OBR86429.1 hypothetical protein I303_02436 [Kwoniella dejecticola CBS 10117]